MEECLDAKSGAATTAADGLPDDSVVEILSRVPVRSIHRFKCVSKPWRDLIADPLHRKRLPQTLEGFFCSDGSGFDGRFISLPGRSAPPVDPSFSFLTKLSGLIKVLGSCNGLLLFEYGWNPATAYAVWNPATEEWVAVPNAGRPSHDPVLEERTYLIFDPAVSPHFHLLYIWQKDFLCEIEVRTYSSETRVWSDRASQQRRWQDEGDWKQWVNNGGAILTSTGACVNGMVHLIIFNMLDEYLIAMFDREGKTCRVIRCPDNCASLFVGQSQGCLHCVGLLVEREESCLKWAGLSIWVLKDYDTEEWVLKHRVSFLELFGQMSCLDGYNSNVLTIHPDRDLIFIHQNSNQKLISYDMDSKELHAFHTLGCDYVSLTPYVPSFLNLVLTNEH
jgi:F-box interacting protein